MYYCKDLYAVIYVKSYQSSMKNGLNYCLFHVDAEEYKMQVHIYNDRPNSQIPQYTYPISHNAPFRTEMCIFVFWMVHCVIWNRCIVRFVI